MGHSRTEKSLICICQGSNYRYTVWYPDTQLLMSLHIHVHISSMNLSKYKWRELNRYVFGSPGMIILWFMLVIFLDFIFLIACIFTYTFHASSMLQLTDQHFIYFKFDCGCNISWHFWCIWEGSWVCMCDLCICWIPVFQWSMQPILSG